MPKQPNGVASLAVDGVDITGGPLGIRTIRAQATLSAELGIQSAFPMEDLSQIATEGRWAQGFRLDSGSLRAMWLTARRTQEADGTGGFEIYFQAQGGAIDRFQQRMEQHGAKSSQLAFFGSAPDPSAPPDKARLRKDGTKWSPLWGALMIESPGKWQVELVPDQPEALKGAMCIRLKGSDADATAALQEVVNKLGLQSALAPPDPKSLERYKILRLLWQTQPEALDLLRIRPREDLQHLPDLKANAQAAEASFTQAAMSADLGETKIEGRLRLAAMLYDHDPKLFVAWAKSDRTSQDGILPLAGASEPNEGLTKALEDAGVAKGSEAWNDGLAATLDPNTARSLLLLGVLAKKDPAKADAAIKREVEAIKLDELHDLCALRGISEARIQNLRFDEVYPGYFTVVDPSLSTELYQSGARYLYSTADNPYRVYQLLTGGQKASLTRFQEGLLVTGKSTLKDFETGGAASVFTRLVTESAIEKSGNGTGHLGGWYDWNGSRPYKLILNRALLNRTDWYGWSADNWGSTKRLTPSNHGATIVERIEAQWNADNEICFPIGNDPAFVDYVSCRTEMQRANLIAELKAQGMKDWRGKSLEEFVVVQFAITHHPDDVSLQTMVRARLKSEPFLDALNAVDTAVKTAVDQAIQSTVAAKAQEVAIDKAKTEGKRELGAHLESIARVAASTAVSGETELVAALDVEGIRAKLGPIAEAAAREDAKKMIENVAFYSTYTIEQAISSATSLKEPAAADAAAMAAIAKLTAHIGTPKDGSPETRQQIKTQLEAAIRAAVREAMESLAKTDGAEVARDTAEEVAERSGYANAHRSAESAALHAASDASIALASPGAIAALAAKVSASLTPTLVHRGQEALGSYGAQWLQPSMKAALEAHATEGAVPLGIDAMLTAAKPAATEIAKTTRDSFATKMPAKVTPEEDAKVAATVATLLTDRATQRATTTAQQHASSKLGGVIEVAAKEAFALLGDEITSSVAKRLAESAARDAAEALLRGLADPMRAVGDAATKTVAKELKVEIGAKLADLALARAGQSLGNRRGLEQVKARVDAALDEIMAKAP